MAEILSRKSLEYLAKLARIEIHAREEEKLLRDLQSILNYFEELKSLDTSGLKNQIPKNAAKNAFREDEERRDTNRGKGREAFPNFRGNFLRIPPVFSQEDENISE
jgi:aspartyl-tRNA(Asn)/glutamyl-tRNA(Gln) amidotransferase subunit C